MKGSSISQWPLSIGVAAASSVLAIATVCGCDSRPTALPAVAASSTATPTPPPLPDGPVVAKTFSTSGPLVAEQQADVAAQRDGRVVEVTVDIGDHVRKGQLMALLDDRTLHAESDEEKAKVASLQAQVKEWQSEQQVNEADLRRADALRSDRILSDEDWEHVKYKLAETVSEVARYKADELGAEAKLQVANLQLAQSQIVAPFAGVVGRRSLRMAQEVKAGDVLFWITAAAPLHVMFTVPESAMRSFERGTSLVLTTGDYPGLKQKGRVYRVSPVVDPASGSVQVIGEVIDPSPLLKPGMTMQVRTAGNAYDAVAQER
jgi:RND family efflux transporter MFP subunit